MRSDERDELFFDALLGERSPDDVERLLADDSTACAQWEELKDLWEELEIVLADPSRKSDALGAVLAPRPRSRRGWGLALAACLATFLVGGWLGSLRTSPPAAPEGARFAVFLYATDDGPRDPHLVSQVIQEQKAWADQLRGQHHHILSEKLAAQPGIDLVAVSGSIQARAEAHAPGPRLGGLYVITAKDFQEATEIARGCPLLRYGGSVRVRAIDDV